MRASPDWARLRFRVRRPTTPSLSSTRPRNGARWCGRRTSKLRRPVEDAESVPVRKFEIEHDEIDLRMVRNYIVSRLSDVSKMATSLSSSFDAPRNAPRRRNVMSSRAQHHDHANADPWRNDDERKSGHSNARGGQG